MTAEWDHTHFEHEVTERWGADAYRRGDAWWRGMSDDERAVWKAESARLTAVWIAAATHGLDPTGAEAQALAARHVVWLRSIPGTPSGPDTIADYLRGLGKMYVADERFTANYGGIDGATFVCAALAAYADSLGQ